MKKLLLAWLLLIVTFINAQVSTYTFSQSNGTYTAITGGTVLGTATGNAPSENLDQHTYPVTLPFSFKFNQVDYTDIVVNTDGNITFGTLVAPSSSPISSTNAWGGAIAAWAIDTNSVFNIGGATGDIRWEVVGTAPNREVVIQWKNFRPRNDVGTHHVYVLSYQIRLQETTNVIKVVYDAGSYLIGNAAINTTVQVGLRGASNTDYNNRTNSTTVAFTASSAGTSNASTQAFHTVNATPGMPAGGLTYTWAPPSCAAPLGLSASNIGPNSATLSWSAPWPAPAGYEYYYSTANTAPTAATMASGTSTTTTKMLSGLVPETTYYVWVKSACGATDQSTWSTMATFKTPCAAVVPGYTNDFSTFPGACWSQASGGTPASGPTGTTNYWATDSFLNSGSAGAAKINLHSNTKKGWLISPVFDVSAGGYQLKFDYGVTAWDSTTPSAMGSDDVVNVLMSVDNGTTWTTIQTWDVANAPNNMSNTFVYQIPSTSSQVKFAIYATEGSVNNLEDYEFFVDNFVVETAPSCVVPAALSASNIVYNGATVSWNAPTTAPTDGYEYYYSTTNTAPVAGTVASGTSNVANAALSGLTANTAYYVWVRSVCSSTNKSDWSSMATFTTPCAPYVPSYTHDFSTFPGTCWSQASGGTPASGPDTGTTDYWKVDGFLNSGSTGAAKINLFSASNQGWLISPVFNLSAGGSVLKFNYGVTAWDSTTPSAMGSDDVVQVLMSVDNGATWTIIQTWNAANAPNNMSNTFVYQIASTSNRVKFALYATDGTTDDATDYDFFVDNFMVESAPVCTVPSNVSFSNLTHTGATVSWTAPATAPANGYGVYVNSTSTPPTAATTPTYPNVMTTSQTIPGTPGTTYYVWVKSVCGAAGSSAWVGPVTYTVPSAPPANDTCTGAVALTVAGNFASGAITSTNVGGTTDGTTTCQSERADNVWYSVVVPPSGSVTIETDVAAGSYLFDTVLSVYSGACGSFTNVACDDDSGDNSFSKLSLSGRTPGETLYVSVWMSTVSNNNLQGEFRISAYDASLATTEAQGVKDDIKVYPNPFADMLNISDVSNVKSISVIDVSGKLVKTFDKAEAVLNLDGLVSGMYLIVLNMKDDSRQTVKVIKK